ncbi:MAG: FAD-dependent pyridine nucleotide-disulfide oxidoreductase [Solirubrobacterales bacterium]|nr:FAD-dependent pyridine nucleotide-disulfide oxidoreductase [Solirubrobacterales bacterium]
MTDEPPIRIAVVGSGPAGFYAAGHLLKDPQGRIEVDMLERLPTPWGLVRSGVAPDHPKIKSVTRVYEKTAANPRFRYFGNITFGVHVSREDLLAHYHAVVYATGSPSDRPLGIPGEELPGSHAATEFVGWYNGHPDHTHLEFDLLSAERAVVIGNGNVALDVARMLVLAPEELAPTDTADHALEVLAASRVSEVVILGRRGPAQAAFTNPELLELGELADADVIVEEAELEQALAVADPGAEEDITCRRNVEILRDYASRPAKGHRKRIVLRFLLSPAALLADEHGRLGAVELVRNELVPAPSGGLRAAGTDERETIPAGLVFRAIGYRGVPLPGVPFDERSATIPNDGGRVLDADSRAPVPGEYVVGWIKRGPSGVIGTNKKDAQQTVDAMLADLAPSSNGTATPGERAGRHVPETPDAAAVEALLRSRQPELVTYSGWEAIDRRERALGEPAGRPRVKLTRIEELLQAAGAEEP